MKGWRARGCGALLTLGFSLAAGAPAAVAQTGAKPLATTPNGRSEVQGATTGLGSSHRFATEAGAMAHCPDDTVVWSSGPGLIYDLPGSEGFGRGQGYYACQAEADDAGFQPAQAALPAGNFGMGQ